MNSINRLVINVTKEDISNGQRKNPLDCMLARAVSRKLGVQTDTKIPCCISYYGSFFRFEGREIFLNSEQLYSYMISFDKGEKVEPFSFMLEWQEGQSFAKVIPLEKASDEKESVALPSMWPIFQEA